MTPIGTREIKRKKRFALCQDCGREIPVGDPCVEVKYYDTFSGAFLSQYTCCKAAHEFDLYPVSELLRREDAYL